MSGIATVRHHWEVLAAYWREESARRRTSRRTRESHDFLPAALEVLETPPSPIGRWLIWAMLGFVAAAILWACLGSVDVVVSAQGKLIPVAHVKVLQSADGGVVRSIRVADGQRVKAGQVLVELDPTQSGADAAQATSALGTARLDEAHAKALLAHATGGGFSYSAPQGTSAVDASTQATLIRSEIAAYEAQLADLSGKRAESAALAGMARLERDKLRDTLPMLSERVVKRRYLAEHGYLSKLQQLELEEQQLTRQRDVGVQATGAARYDAATRAIDAQLRNLKQQFIKDAATTLAKAESEIALRSAELAKATQRSQLQRLISPIDGIVQQLSIHTIGAVIKPADPILVVVPVGGTMIVEAQVLNRDVGQLRSGQPVSIKLDAFQFTRFGTIPGRLVGISRDAVQDEKRGLVYVVRVDLPCDRRNIYARDLSYTNSTRYLCERAGSGMTATADIKTEERRIIGFLLSPIQRRLAEAGRER